MSSLYEIFMLPTLPNYLSCHIHRCFDGLHDAVWYHLEYIRVLQMYCPILFFQWTFYKHIHVYVEILDV